MIAPVSLHSIAEELIAAARANNSHRAARTVLGDQHRQLRHTLIALAEGATMGEHEAPGEGSLYVIEGEVDLRGGSDNARLKAGELAEIPPERHSVQAITESVILLTAIPPEFETPFSSRKADR